MGRSLRDEMRAVHNNVSNCRGREGVDDDVHAALRGLSLIVHVLERDHSRRVSKFKKREKRKQRAFLKQIAELVDRLNG